MVFQDSVLFDWRTVSKNVALPLEMLGCDRAKRKERVEEMLRLVELQGFGDHHPWQLSGGMQMRVAIARALVVRAGAAPDGRAVRRARRDDARASEHRAARDLAAHAVDDRVRHTLDLGGGVPVDPRRRHEPAARARSPALVDIDLPQPRTNDTREDPHFFELVTEVRELLRGVGADEHGSVLAEERS